MTAGRAFVAALAIACAGAPVIAGVGACDHSPDAPAIDDAALDRAATAITAADLAAHVSFLASDALRGRLTPSPQLNLAASYIAERFQAAGLAPAGDAGSFLQHYPCEGVPTSDLPANVVGILRGSDPGLAGEWVVVSAHYDHVGVGMPDARGDSVYNGADDNASGTAGLLEVARAFSALPRRPARSVAFVAVSGEELGLVGSAYFAGHTPPAIGTMVADVNLDMIGRNAPDLVYLVGDSLSSLGPIAFQLAARHAELGLAPRSLDDVTYRLSDQLSFALAGVPAIFLHTGSHPDLHRPSDDVSHLDAEKASRVARLAFYLTYQLAAASTRPTWTDAGRRLTSTVPPYNASCAAR